jgi:protein-S-isoprenylcysteine O-methyltransferase Ste14
MHLMNFFDYFQIAIIALIICVIAGKAAYLRATTGINPIVIGRATEGAWRIVELLALVSLVAWLVEVVLHALHSPYDMFPDRVELALLHTQPVRILGATLAGIGFLVFVLAFFSFGDSWRIGIDRKTAGTLVTGGIFSISRNPIYVGFDLLFIGILLMNGTWFFLIFAVLAIVAVHAQILREEKFLTQRYGEAYERYRKEAPRYLIW